MLQQGLNYLKKISCRSPTPLVKKLLQLQYVRYFYNPQVVNQDSFCKIDGCFLRLTSLFVAYNVPALRAPHAYSDLKINSSILQYYLGSPLVLIQRPRAIFNALAQSLSQYDQNHPSS